MALILCIETSQQEASVALSVAGVTVALECCKTQKEHAAFLHPAIQRVMKNPGFRLDDLDAIAVSEGPGSYTGLRAGMAAAKGLSFALHKPLICISTLMLMAAASREAFKAEFVASDYLLVPMIDARRNEVFTAVYDGALQTITPPFACILHENAFMNYGDKKLVFSGGGAVKWKPQCKQTDSYFPAVDFNASCMTTLATEKFNRSEFTPLEIAVPFYLKDFQAVGSPALKQ
ncbi:MAG: tRNA (adenosine(37)-N6)-threonylcarbamoyltransferase complex dimerization subunit type 1 TsaB [Bacteroidetes bacterium]|nr:tRNA (adenosine(37)-N6)-threonylcarbamoyltransferase complex dimerization subunit type 1 TsaB [Bacteroidota bacterium]